MKTILMLGMVLVLTNCAHHGTANDTFDLAVGMGERDVKEVMGEPRAAFKDVEGDTVRYVYNIGNGFGFNHPYTCTFQGGRLRWMGYTQSTGSTAGHFSGMVAAYPIPNPNIQQQQQLQPMPWLYPLPGTRR